MLARSPTAEGDEPGSNERWVSSVTGLFQSFEKARAQAEASRQWEVAIIGRIQAVAEQIDRRRGEHAEPCSGVHLLPPCVHAQLQDEDKESLRKLGRARRKRKARSTRVRATSADEQLGRDCAGDRDRHRTRSRSSRAEAQAGDRHWTRRGPSRAEAEAEAEAEEVEAKRESSGDGAGGRDRRRPRSCNARASSSGNAEHDRRWTPHRSSKAEAEAEAEAEARADADADAEAKRKRSGDGAGGRFRASNAHASSRIAAPPAPERVPTPSVDISSGASQDEIISGRDVANNARMRALPRLSGKTRTASVTNWSLQNVWERSHASTAADAITTRQFTMLHKTEMWPDGRLPYLLTVPAVHSAGHSEGHKFPLLVYLHSAGPVSQSKGDYEVAQMGLVAGEAPHSCVIESGRAGTVDNFIAISPCCPPNVTVFGTQHGRDWVPKRVATKKKNYWFKTCDENAYHGWEFTGCYRCVEVELATIELIAHVCKILPVDPRRIYFYGVSAGGYGALRLGELLCDLPAAIVPIAGYYPDMPDRGHCTETMAKRLQRIPCVWPMHCSLDKLCNVESPHVSKAYGRLHDRGIFVDWIEGPISKGSNKNYHSPHQKILKDPNAFFNKLLDHTKANVEDPVVYLHRRIAELQMALTAA